MSFGSRDDLESARFEPTVPRFVKELFWLTDFSPSE